MTSLNSLSVVFRVLFVCFSLSTLATGQDQVNSSRLSLTPCEITGVRGEGRCGRYEVFEDRASRRGRKISLKIVVLPATGAERAPDPFVYIPGGPGSSATEDAPGIAEAFAKIREHRDLVFVDQRGTGGSHPLNCYRRGIVASGSNGLYLSITCAEDLPWIKPGEGERLAAKTFLGDYRLRQQREACALWPRATIPAEYSDPTSATTPVLILTGEWDPVTPPSNAKAVARYLTNSLNIVVPHGAHGLGSLEGLDCLERLSTEFVEKGTVRGLDTACVKGIRRKGFALKL